MFAAALLLLLAVDAHAFTASQLFPIPVKAGSAWTTLPAAPATGNGSGATVE